MTINLLVAASRRQRRAIADPTPAARVHPMGCTCGRPCSAGTPATPSLVQRFHRAADPGDWIALIVGAQMGVALVTLLVIAHEWGVIAPALASLW